MVSSFRVQSLNPELHICSIISSCFVLLRCHFLCISEIWVEMLISQWVLQCLFLLIPWFCVMCVTSCCFWLLFCCFLGVFILFLEQSYFCPHIYLCLCWTKDVYFLTHTHTLTIHLCMHVSIYMYITLCPYYLGFIQTFLFLCYKSWFWLGDRMKYGFVFWVFLLFD